MTWRLFYGRTGVIEWIWEEAVSIALWPGVSADGKPHHAVYLWRLVAGKYWYVKSWEDPFPSVYARQKAYQRAIADWLGWLDDHPEVHTNVWELIL